MSEQKDSGNAQRASKWERKEVVAPLLDSAFSGCPRPIQIRSVCSPRLVTGRSCSTDLGEPHGG